MRCATDALENGDAANLLLYEHPRDTGDADSPQDHHHQADQAQIVFRPLEVLAHPVLVAAIRANEDELVRECLPQIHRQGG